MYIRELIEKKRKLQNRTIAAWQGIRPSLKLHRSRIKFHD